MDVKTLSQQIGRIGNLAILQSPLKIDIRILNVRQAWNRIDYLVTPVHGEGEQWVAANRVTISPFEGV